MYDMSGGCNHEHTCGECKFYEAVKKPVKGKGKTVWGKTAEGNCLRHPLHTAEWKESYMACKWWKSPYQKTIVKSSEGQCEGQITLDMFL